MTKITIVPRTSGALGYTMQVDEGQRSLMSRWRSIKLPPLLAGGLRKSWCLWHEEMTTGASNDVEQATKLARSIIARYGMSEEFDMVALETTPNQYLGGDTS